jgi:acyl-coenzyme A synthetase/AMP-(fatty) acid ligase/REP element-mobilizing transposase RayT
MHDSNILEDQPIAWTPTPEVIERAQLTKFMKQVGVSTWDELYEYSIRDVAKFTEEVLKFLDIKFDPPYEKLLDVSDGIEFPKWFSRSGDRSGDTPVPIGGSSAESSFERRGDVREDKSVLAPESSFERRGDVREDKSVLAPAGLNITTMCLDRWQTDEMKDQPAVIWEGENGDVATLTFEKLLADVIFCAAGLKQQGLGRGDAIGIHLPMIPDTIISLLAIARIGAVAVPVFSGYGVSAIEARLNAVGAKALFTCDGFSRRGKTFDAFSVARQAISNCPTIEKVYVSKITGSLEDSDVPDDLFGKYIYFQSLCEGGGWSSEKQRGIEPTAAEDPLIILYTSGTTGKPKGIAHTHASFPIKSAQDMAFGMDVGRGTRICWYTDIGWMMGPWLIYGALINGGTICIYDGAPDYPTADRMWEFCAKHKVEILGIAPTLIRSLARSGDTPVPIGGSSAESSFERRSDVREDKSVLTPKRKGWSRSGKLPHFDGEVTQFITFRLADSLPKSALDRLKLQLEHDKLPEDSEKYRQRVEEYLDQGSGECLLKNAAAAAIVEETLLNEHGVSCDLRAWTIMPNHAHILVRMLDGHDLAGLMKRVKGISARRINQLLGREGILWQSDYFDRYIRDGEHYSKTFRYIENNPVISKLSDSKENFRFSSAWSGRSGDTPVPMDAASASKETVGGGTADEDKSVLAPHKRHDLSSLRAFASSGEPWNPAPWWWLFEKVGNTKLPIINYSGGTEISGGILCGNPLLPQKPCSFPAPCPGMDVDILDENGEPVKPGEVGELVIKQPWIGMARGFWKEKERYLDTYWRRFPNIWVHGDWAMRDADGHWFILGRSDDTLKVAGKRVGPAEVEGLLVSHPQVTEAAVIGVPDEVKGTAMVAFVVISNTSQVKSAEEISDSSLATHHSSLETELKTLVSRDMGKPLAPSKIHFVSALPKTRNAKVMRRVIRSAYLGEDPGDITSLENPAAVDEISRAGKEHAD